METSVLSLKERTQKLWYTAGWESRTLRRATRRVDARATATRRLRGDDALASMPLHAHRGGGPVFLAQLSSTDDCSCPLAPRRCWTRSLTHTALCIAQSVCSSSQRLYTGWKCMLELLNTYKMKKANKSEESTKCMIKNIPANLRQHLLDANITPDN
jgi:hypothetical protein